MIYEKENIISLSRGLSNKAGGINDLAGGVSKKGSIVNKIACVIKFYKEQIW